MIINNTYFSNNLYLPHAKSSLTDAVKDVPNKVQDYIDDYVPECLIECLGSLLGEEFIAKLDSEEANGLIAGTEAKWDELLNGKTYTNPKGDEVVWKGIRRKSSAASEYNRSFLANYVFFFYESNDSETRSAVGSVRLEAANAIRVSSGRKAIKAWREFVQLVQGDDGTSTAFFKEGQYGGLGIDYSIASPKINLYKFIEDSNELVADTYAEFKPKVWVQMNQLSI